MEYIQTVSNKINNETYLLIHKNILNALGFLEKFYTFKEFRSSLLYKYGLDNNSNIIYLNSEIKKNIDFNLNEIDVDIFINYIISFYKL